MQGRNLVILLDELNDDAARAARIEEMRCGRPDFGKAFLISYAVSRVKLHREKSL